MKTSTFAASLLFSTLALAAPLEKRAYATKTQVVVQTVVVYTTVYDGQAPKPTLDAPGAFYEVKTTPTTTMEEIKPSTPAYVAPVQDEANKVQNVQPTPETTPTTTSVPPAAPTTTTLAEPSTSSTYVALPPASTSAEAAPAPAPASAPATGSGDGETYTGSYTMNYYQGGLGACGEPVNDGDMVVALGVDLFGTATVDYMTGKTTNKWCGKTIDITNNGVTVKAKIVDRCPGCTGAGLDATPALWKATTGGLGGASGDRIYSMSWKVSS